MFNLIYLNLNTILFLCIFHTKYFILYNRKTLFFVYLLGKKDSDRQGDSSH